MKRNTPILILLLLTICCGVHAGQVSEQRAQTIALNFFRLNAPQVNDKTPLVAVLNFARTELDNSVDFFVFDIHPATGFVIVSGDDNMEPVIAYSTESAFHADNGHIGVINWMNGASAKISSAIKAGVQADDRITNLWTSYYQGINPGSAKAATVGPLCTTTWNQENGFTNPPPFIYNLLCPNNSTDNQRCVTGCVATAMAQIMKFWNSPAQGTGSYSYNDDTKYGFSNTYGVQSANFGATTYNWAGMPDALTNNTTASQDSTVDVLMYHCGVSVGMDYGDDNEGGSGAYVLQSEAGLNQPCAQNSYHAYFGYNASSMKGVQAVNYTSANWASLIQSELDAGRPVQYEGFDTINGGHTWVCDGYEANSLFHMNWGWGGYDNGYFSLTNLSVANFVFNSGDAALIGIQPSVISACNAPGILAAGTLSNTSAFLSWSAATGATSYDLQWKETSASSWTTVSGLTNPSYSLSGLSACTGYQFQVATVCNSGTSAYSAPGSFTTTGCVPVTYCTSASTLNYLNEFIKTVSIGTIHNTVTRGAKYADYTSLSTNLAGGASTSVSVAVGAAGTMALPEYFTVYIDYNHNGSFNDPGELVAEMYGSVPPAKSFLVPTSALNGPTRMRVQMQQGSYETNPCASFANGGVQDYTVNITGNLHIEIQDPQEELSDGLKLYPNPAKDNITVQFNSGVDGLARVSIYSLTGQRLINAEAASYAGKNIQDVNTSQLASGVYVFEIENNGELKRQKFIITK